MFAFLVMYRSRLRNIFIILTTHLKGNATLGQNVQTISGELLIGETISETVCVVNMEENTEREFRTNLIEFCLWLSINQLKLSCVR